MSEEMTSPGMPIPLDPLDVRELEANRRMREACEAITAHWNQYLHWSNERRVASEELLKIRALRSKEGQK